MTLHKKGHSPSYRLSVLTVYLIKGELLAIACSELCWDSSMLHFRQLHVDIKVAPWLGSDARSCSVSVKPFANHVIT